MLSLTEPIAVLSEDRIAAATPILRSCAERSVWAAQSHQLEKLRIGFEGTKARGSGNNNRCLCVLTVFYSHIQPAYKPTERVEFYERREIIGQRTRGIACAHCLLRGQRSNGGTVGNDPRRRGVAFDQPVPQDRHYEQNCLDALGSPGSLQNAPIEGRTRGKAGEGMSLFQAQVHVPDSDDHVHVAEAMMVVATPTVNDPEQQPGATVFVLSVTEETVRAEAIRNDGGV
jgi:hypothetical protein